MINDLHSVSYAELIARVISAAHYLSECGVRQGEVIGISLADETEHLVASLALFHLGAKQITLATFDSPSLHQELAARAGLTRRLTLQVQNAIDIAWSVESAVGVQTAAQLDGMLYLKTSGTTGRSNIVPLTLVQLFQQALRHPEYANERLLRLASIEHNNSKRHRLYCVLVGGTNVFRTTAGTNLIEFCAQHNVTTIDVSRLHASDLASAHTGTGFSAVKITCAGSALPYEVRRQVLDTVTPHLYVRYGSTESGTMSVAGPNEHSVDESVGRPVPGIELEIVSAEGARLAAGEIGYIRIFAPGMALSYLDSPVDTAKRFRDGWFWPGDMGKIEQDGSLYIMGRQDDMMILNGINIFPFEIERVLEQHPSVSVAAAFPLDSKIHGQIPVAAVELKADQDISVEELQNFAREHMGLRCPRRILILEKLPRNSRGKILKRALAPLFDFSKGAE